MNTQVLSNMCFPFPFIYIAPHPPYQILPCAILYLNLQNSTSFKLQNPHLLHLTPSFSSFPPTQPRPRIILPSLPLLLPSLLRLRIPSRPTRISSLRKMTIILMLARRRPRRRRRRNISLRQILLLPPLLLLRWLTPGLMLLLLCGGWIEELLMCGGRDRVILVVLGWVVLGGTSGLLLLLLLLLLVRLRLAKGLVGFAARWWGLLVAII
jgi:hypothetical protein